MVAPSRFAGGLALVLLLLPAFSMPTGGAATASLQHSGGGVVFTFSDGLASAPAAAQTLRSHGLFGTFYVASGMMSDGTYYTAYMTPGDVANLAAAGHEVGSMTVTHPDLTTLSAAQLDAELANSRSALESITGTPVAQAAYPYGSVNSVVAAAAASHYDSGRTLTGSVAAFTSSVDAYHLPGLIILSSTSLATAESYVDYAASHNVYVVLAFGGIVANPGTYDWTPSNLDALAAYVQSKGVSVATVSQLLSGGSPPPPSPTRPGAPTLSSATPGASVVSLSWTTPSNGGSAINGFKIYRGTASGAETLYKTLGVQTSYSDTSVANGNTYYYKLTATNAIGESDQSNEKSAKPGVPSGARIVFTFDDGDPSHAAAAKQVADHGFRATFYIVSNCAKSVVGPGCLTSTQIQQLAADGHDIGSHTVNHPDLTTLSASQLTAELANSQQWLQNLVGKPVHALAYPYGAHNPTVRSQTAQYYTNGRIYLGNPAPADLSTLLAQSGTNPYVVPGIGVMAATSLPTAKAYVDYAIAHGTTIVLTFHTIVDRKGTIYSWTPSNLGALLDYTASTGVSVQTMAQVYG